MVGDSNLRRSTEKQCTMARLVLSTEDQRLQLRGAATWLRTHPYLESTRIGELSPMRSVSCKRPAIGRWTSPFFQPKTKGRRILDTRKAARRCKARRSARP